MYVDKAEPFSEEMKTENEPKYEGEWVTVSLSAMIFSILKLRCIYFVLVSELAQAKNDTYNGLELQKH